MSLRCGKVENVAEKMVPKMVEQLENGDE